MAGGNFPGIRALVDAMGQLEGIDFNLIFRLLREGVTLAQIRKWYWERPDFIFLAPVHTVIDIARFTFTWRGKVLIARAFPDTSTLTSGDVVLIRKLPASAEYFTIIYAQNELFVCMIIPGAPNTTRVAYCRPSGAATVWELALFSPTLGVADIDIDVATPSIGYSISGNNQFTLRVERSVAMKTEPWTVILNNSIFYAATGAPSDVNDRFSCSAVQSVEAAPGFICMIIDFNGSTSPSGRTRQFVFHSHDNGTTWGTPVELGDSTQTELSRLWTAIAISASNPDVIYANVFDTFGGFVTETWKSTDRAHSFVRVDNTGDDATFYVDYLSVKRTDPNVIWGWGTGTEGLWESIDGGITWARVDSLPASPFPDSRPVHAVTATGAKMLSLDRAPLPSKVRISLDTGRNWTSAGAALTTTPIEELFVVKDGVYATVHGGVAIPPINAKVSTWNDALVETDITTNLLVLVGHNRPIYAGMAATGVPFY